MRVEQAHPIFETTTRPQAPAPAPEQGPAAAPAPGVLVDIGVPALPPPEVLERVHEAAERALAMAAENRELHFRKDPGVSRVIVEVRDLQGNVIRTIPPSRALELMTPEIWS
jgi:FlaG protein